tara:strand:- start:9 stop:281 length:273 start_codon:yes stop_codon:yes gene_type:complete
MGGCVVGKLHKMIKRTIDPTGLILKDKKKKKIVPRTPAQLKQDTADAESLARRTESAARLRNHRATNPFPTIESGVIDNPGARSSKLFGE